MSFPGPRRVYVGSGEATDASDRASSSGKYGNLEVFVLVWERHRRRRRLGLRLNLRNLFLRDRHLGRRECRRLHERQVVVAIAANNSEPSHSHTQCQPTLSTPSFSKPRRWHAPDELACEPQERLLELVVRLGRDVKVLEVLLAVERNLLGLHLAVLHLDLVAAEHDRDVLAHAEEVAVPVRHVLVRDPRRHVKHDDRALALDVVAVAEAAKLLLAGRVPAVEADRTKVRVEHERVDLDTERG